MEDKILERLRKEFDFVGDERYQKNYEDCNWCCKWTSIPKEVESAKKYVDECERDMGFMGF
jgi:hypothetical protein